MYAQFLRRDICSGSGGRLLRISFRDDEFTDMFFLDTLRLRGHSDSGVGMNFSAFKWLSSSVGYQAGQAADEGEALAVASLLASWLGLSIFHRRQQALVIVGTYGKVT